MNVSFDDVADQDDFNDRVPEPFVATPKGLTIKEESDDDLQQSCSKIKSSRSTRALKKIDINFHPSNKLSMDAANHDEQETIQDLKTELEKFISQSGFYFSYSADLTLSLQDQKEKQPSLQSKAE